MLISINLMEVIQFPKEKFTRQENEIDALHQHLEDLKMQIIANENHNSNNSVPN